MSTERIKDFTFNKKLPNTKDWANTATSVLREFIEQYNKLAKEVVEMRDKLEQTHKDKMSGQ